MRAFFTTYCSAFIRLDAPAVVRHFANTIQVASDSGDKVTVHVATADEWRKTIDHLLEMYRAIEFGWAEAIALSCDPISRRLVHAHLRWSLQDKARQPLYEFDALYTLARHTETFRIISIAHNEIPEYRRCLAGRGARGAGRERPEPAKPDRGSK